MSVLIKGMKMPEACWDCFVDNALAQNIAYFEAICPFTERIVTFADFDAMSGRHPECPLVEVPTPHGRLVDCETLKDNLAVLFERNEILIDVWLVYAIDDLIDELPTIIEAEEE